MQTNQGKLTNQGTQTHIRTNTTKKIDISRNIGTPRRIVELLWMSILEAKHMLSVNYMSMIIITTCVKFIDNTSMNKCIKKELATHELHFTLDRVLLKKITQQHTSQACEIFY